MFRQVSDEMSIFRMELLTWFGKRLLPQGHWHGTECGTNTVTPVKRLYLTYDDGPCRETTPALLEFFAQEDVKATFFMIGSHAEQHPDLVSDMVKTGHTLGNHSFDHQFMPLLSTRLMEKQIVSANDSIEQIAGVRPQYFRAPYGVLDERGARCIKEQGMKPVYWGAVSEDWLPIGADRVIARVKRKLSDGTLIVLHEGWFPKQTVEATREIVKLGKSLGYEFAALPTS